MVPNIVGPREPRVATVDVSFEAKVFRVNLIMDTRAPSIPSRQVVPFLLVDILFHKWGRNVGCPTIGPTPGSGASITPSVML